VGGGELSAGSASPDAPGPAPAPPPGGSPPAEGSPEPPVRPSARSWLGALLRLWCLRPLDGAPRGTGGAAIAALAITLLAAWVVIDRWQRQPDPEFSADGIALLGWYGMGVLGLAALLAWRAKTRLAFGAALVLSLGAVPLPLLLMSVGIFYLDTFWLGCAGAAVAVHGAVYLARGLKALTGRTQRAAALLGVLFAAGFIYASDALDAIPDVWNPAAADTAPSEEDLAEREQVLFEQADRIDAALEPVHRGRGAAPEAFFLGFAGVGEQKVFAQEIGLASRVLGERYAMGERRLSLINDERDLERAPIASVSGLNHALEGLAARMDLERDVLFLAISSHGSEDAAVAVSNSDMPLQSLTAEELAGALKDAGIQWRVIIISACFAGGFIDALRDPKTIVITAAAADRTSFGCSNDSDLTYFGEAFYRDALPGAPSLRAAFESAKAAIAARERAEHQTPSNPQAWFGAELEARLDGIARQETARRETARPGAARAAAARR
jgi:hypothetical protein